MCPKCKCPFLLIKGRHGLERLKIAFTGKREYTCTNCDNVFRIKDRRRFSRAAHPIWGALTEK